MSTKTARRKIRAGAIAGGVCGSVTTLALFGRARILRWGATDKEIVDLLPGDDLIAEPNLAATRAITVRCAPDVVWPWIVQLGQGRGGFYSYDFLENLLGLDIHSAERIVPEWQRLEVGDDVRLAATVGLRAAIVEPGRALVLQGSLPIARKPPFDSTWAFVLREQADGTTRLLSRERYGYKRWWAPLVVEPTQAMSFAMSRKMLLGIRDRAERSVRSPSLSTSHEPTATEATATPRREEVKQ
jgi:hypothetical protein